MTSVLTGIRETGLFEEIGGCSVLRTAGDAEGEYRALREGAMFYDCSAYGFCKVEGEGADRLLEKLATKDIQYLNEGNISECYFLDEEASVVGSVFILRRENDFVIIAPWEHAEAVKRWLSSCDTEGDAKITDMSGTVAALTIEGPESWKAVQDILDTDVTGIGLRSSETLEWNGEEITLMRIGRTSEYGYVIMASVEKAKEIYEATGNKQWDFPVREGGLDTLELAMLEVHQPNFIRETPEFGNVFELAQQWYIQYDKEDYTGHEKLMEIFEKGIRRGAVGFSSENDCGLEPGSEVKAAGEVIGRVVYGMYSYGLDKFLGIAVLDSPYGQAGLELEAVGTEGAVNISTLSGPFIRPLSWDKKME